MRIALFLLLASSAFADSAKPDVEKAVLAAEKVWADAVVHGDAATLKQVVADDLMYTHSSGKTETKAEFIQAATSGGTTYKSIEFEDTKVRQFGTTAVVTHKAVITTVQTGVAHLYLTEVWALKGGKWLLASRQATKLP
jgi:ketosteroid isomerase-like protein